MEDTWHMLLGLLVVLLVAFLTWHYFKYGSSGGKGFTVYPFLGILPDLLTHYSHLVERLTDALGASRNLSFFGPIPGTKWLFTGNPVHVEHILKTNFPNYVRGQGFRDVLQELLGDSIVTSDGVSWRFQRKVLSHEFSTNTLRNYMLEAFQSETRSRLLPLLDWAADTSTVVDFQDVITRYNFDNICAVGFGTDPAALSKDFPDVPFATCLIRAAEASVGRYVLPSPVWKTMRALNLGPEAQLKKDIEVVHGFVQAVIDKRRRELSHKQPVGSVVQEGTSGKLERSDILSRLMSMGESEHGQEFSDTFLRDSSLAFLMAGRDTTASALTWFFWVLSQHPRVEGKILEELQGIKKKREREVPGRNSLPAKDLSKNSVNGTPEPCLGGSLFSFEEMKEMVYTQAAINEAMRLHSPFPFDQRCSVEEDVLPDGTFIGKGWRVSYCMGPMGRLKTLWGPDADEYKPERWIDEKGMLKTVSPFQYLVFNAGYQSCLGKEMAYLQMKSVVSSIIPQYKMKTVLGHKGEYILAMTMAMKGGLPMIVSRRD